MPYEIRKVRNGYKVCKKRGNKCFSKEGLTLEKAKKQLKAIGLNEHLKGASVPKNLELYNKIKSSVTGMGKGGFEKQLKGVGLDEKKYLEIVKKVAEKRGYNPEKLTISDDGIHKLEYDGVKFGRVNYNDKIIYMWLEKNGKVPKGTTKNKYTNYRARAEKVMKATNNKYSPASLAFNLVW